ncbi:MAG TPA: sulfotransferase [Acetobacteraceae bacterium]
MTDRPSRDSLIQDAFTEAGRIARSDALLRRDLDSGSGGAALPGLPGRSPGTAQRDTRAAKEQRRRGLQLLRAGRAGEAILVLRKAAQSDPENAEAHHALGLALLQDGQLAAAASSLTQAVGHKSDFALAYRDLGTALDRQGFDLEAIEAFRRAIALSPKLAGVHQRLGELHEMRGGNKEAIACFRQAAAAAPDTTPGRLCLARALLLERDIQAASALLRKTLTLDPASGDAHNALAGVLVSEGRMGEGIEHYQESLRLNPKLLGSWNGIVRARTFTTADQPVIDRLQATLAQERLNDQERMVLHFALGKVHDDLHEYAEAMRHFDAANGVRARSISLDRAVLASWVDRLIERFTPDLFDRLAAFGTADETPLLIVGMPRSGTTLVEQIVSSQPAIAAGDELPFWVKYAAGWDGVDGEGFTVEAAHGVAAAYLGLLREIGPSAARVTDKLPFNFRRLGLIHTLLPGARIIHCRRHPVDTCLSIYSILFGPKMDFVGSKADLTFFYRQYVRLTDHWRAVLPADRFLEVEYERLIAEPEAESRRLIAFTGLDWDDACLRPERNNRNVRTASAWQARQPVYASSVERWRHYEPWLGELRELLPAPAAESGDPSP